MVWCCWGGGAVGGGGGGWAVGLGLGGTPGIVNLGLVRGFTLSQITQNEFLGLVRFISGCFRTSPSSGVPPKNQSSDSVRTSPTDDETAKKRSKPSVDHNPRRDHRVPAIG